MFSSYSGVCHNTAAQQQQQQQEEPRDTARIVPKTPADPAQTGADRMTDAAKIHLTGPDITLSQQSAGLISMTLPFAFPW